MVVLIAFVLASCGGGASRNTPSGSAARTDTPPISTEAASFARSAPAALEFGADAGSIRGHIGYPCECLPSMAIYAISTDGVRYYRVETVAWQQSYTMLGVAPGDYWVLTTARGISAPTASEARTITAIRFGAGYTKAVLCGLSVDCTDHSLLAVHVAASASASNIDPVDWYAPDPSAIRWFLNRFRVFRPCRCLPPPSPLLRTRLRGSERRPPLATKYGAPQIAR
jgi:hypothetical protein